MLKQKKREIGAKKINILVFRLVNIVHELNARLGRDVREMACMLCAKKTIFIIEKNTTILQSMFVIFQKMEDRWPKGKQGLERGILLLY